MKWLTRMIGFGFLCLISIIIVNPHKASASVVSGIADWNGVSRTDADYYYYDNGLCYYWQYQGYSPYMYEQDWGWWSDPTPQIDKENMYNNQDIFGYRLMGTTNDFGFQAVSAYWVGDRFSGNWGAPWNVIYQRKVSSNYIRKKTIPTVGPIDVLDAQYVNGNDYWIQPGRKTRIHLTTNQDFKGNKVQLDDWINTNYFQMVGNDGSDFRTATTWTSGGGSWNNIFKVADINASYDSQDPYASKQTSWGTTTNVQPMSNNKDYSLRGCAYSNNGKWSTCYQDSGRFLKTDGDAPTQISSVITGANYVAGNTYWFLPNNPATISYRQYDGRSGNRFTYLRLFNGSGIDVRGYQDFTSASNSFSQYYSNPAIAITSANRTENSGGYGTVKFGINPVTSSQKYDVQYGPGDNVGNASDWTSTGMTLGVDGVAPTVSFRNTADSADFTSRDWDNTPINLRLKFTDSDSGFKQYRYAWTQSTAAPTSWSAWSTSADSTVTTTGYGQWYLHVQAQDNVGNLKDTYSGPYNFNNPPVADFSYSPAIVYNDTNVAFTNASTDADGNALTYNWEYQAPGSSTWTSFSIAKNPSKILNIKGTWNIRLTVSDGIASNSVVKAIIVQNRPPLPNFTWSPSTIYNDTTVTFTDSSSDPDGDFLSYRWSYQAPNSSTWVDFSTSKNPTKVLNIKGDWNIMLTVSDGTVSTSVVKVITVQNRPPVAGFNTDKTSYVMSDTVFITSTATDPDNDTLSYSYVVTKPDGQTLTFTTANPTFNNLQIGTYKIQQTVTDTSGVSISVTKYVDVVNRPPVADLTYTPDDPYEGDLANICVKATDEDLQPLTVKIFIKKDGGTEQMVLNKSNVTSGTQSCYSFTIDTGRYDVRTEVNDGYDTTGASTWFITKLLTLKGHVLHTSDWQAKHQTLGHAENQFYSGETFVLQADTSPHPVEYVKSTLKAVQSDDQPIVRTVDLSAASNILFQGNLFDQKFLEYPTNIKKGKASFEFEVKYLNGVIKKDSVDVEIIDNVFEAYKLHRKY